MNKVHIFSDIHFGNKGINLRALNQDIGIVRKNPRARWIGGGDLFEAIWVNDKRFVKENHEIDYWENLVDRAAEIFAPIKDKCIGLLDGNHESKLAQRNGSNMMKSLAKKLDTEYLGYESLIRISVGSKKCGFKSVVYYVTHGNGGGRYIGGQLNKLENMTGMFDANFYVMCHVHMKGNADPFRHRISESGNEITEPIKLVISGTYQNVHNQKDDSYASTKGFRQYAPGGPVTYFNWIGHDHDLQIGTDSASIAHKESA